MRFSTIIFALAAVTSAFASPTVADKWISVETGMTLANGNNVTLERRIGTEVITCYGFGTAVDRAPSISVIDNWCNSVAIGQYVPIGATLWGRYDYGSFTILVSALALGNPSCGGFVIDGNCNRLLRLPLDGCNTRGENGKQGGYETDLCGQWRYDPGSKGSDV
ncbi:hypothetical protein D9613_004023 [Agrocybe pediades]|uniref:Uncharacterized protein n=1 Tax=Agrocybe pediades TaxID=84607 RepID=A0A8H4QJ10_9AGAR|nr:hypothetical protein D9613_004023 [Agrocybe pediades]